MSDRLRSELAQLDAKVVQARERIAALGVDQEAASREAHNANDALVQAYANEDADPKALKRLTEVKQATADAMAQPWEAMVAGARSAVRNAEAEVAAFVTENLDGLLSEHEPYAWAVARGVQDAVSGVAGAVQGWHAEEQEIARLLRLAGAGHHRRTRDLAVDPLARELKRVAGRIEPPLPVDSPRGDLRDDALLRVEGAVK